MEVKAFRARSMQEALQLVRRTLGPDATLLQAREVRNGLLGWLPGVRQIEVLASADVQAPCRLPASAAQGGDWEDPSPDAAEPGAERNETRLALTSWDCEYRARFRAAVLADQAEPQSLVEELSRRSPRVPLRHWSEAAVCVYTDLLDAEVPEDLARELIERVCQGGQLGEIDDSLMLRARLARLLESEIQVSGPLVVQSGKTRVVALVGPTGVGKTTTLAKLAADYRLRQQRRVGLVTVDTYRIAAVEQLRTYADIIDLPMEVVSSPREMREAVRRMASLDLILMDTAGRSPRDEIKIQELRSFLSEAEADEVLLVLSSVAGERTLTHTAERFASVGTTGMILTKLDEATSLGNMLPLTRTSRLPIRYVTNGQSVPDDIETANAARLARLILGQDTVFRS